MDAVRSPSLGCNVIPKDWSDGEMEIASLRQCFGFEENILGMQFSIRRWDVVLFPKVVPMAIWISTTGADGVGFVENI